jgi:hypothetical protein
MKPRSDPKYFCYAGYVSRISSMRTEVDKVSLVEVTQCQVTETLRAKRIGGWPVSQHLTEAAQGGMEIAHSRGESAKMAQRQDSVPDACIAEKE